MWVLRAAVIEWQQCLDVVMVCLVCVQELREKDEQLNSVRAKVEQIVALLRLQQQQQLQHPESFPGEFEDVC